MSLKGGKGGAPLWASVLVAAEAWGTPPWEIAERRGGPKWLARFQELRRLREFVETAGQAVDEDEDE